MVSTKLAYLIKKNNGLVLNPNLRVTDCWAIINEDLDQELWERRKLQERSETWANESLSSNSAIYLQESCNLNNITLERGKFHREKRLTRGRLAQWVRFWHHIDLSLNLTSYRSSHLTSSSVKWSWWYWGGPLSSALPFEASDPLHQHSRSWLEMQHLGWALDQNLHLPAFRWIHMQIKVEKPYYKLDETTSSSNGAFNGLSISSNCSCFEKMLKIMKRIIYLLSLLYFKYQYESPGLRFFCRYRTNNSTPESGRGPGGWQSTDRVVFLSCWAVNLGRGRAQMMLAHPFWKRRPSLIIS